MLGLAHVWHLEDGFSPSTVWVLGSSGLVADTFIIELSLLFHKVYLKLIIIATTIIIRHSNYQTQKFLGIIFTIFKASTLGMCQLLLLVTMQFLQKDGFVLSTVVITPTAEFLRQAVAKTKTN